MLQILSFERSILFIYSNRLDESKVTEQNLRFYPNNHSQAGFVCVTEDLKLSISHTPVQRQCTLLA